MTDTLQISYTATAALAATLSPAGATRISQDYSLPGDGSAHEVDVVLTRSLVQALLILTDQNCTMKTNSSSSPDDTITIVAGVPILVGLSGKVPQGSKTAATFFAADITKLFFINTSSGPTAGSIYIRAILT